VRDPLAGGHGAGPSPLSFLIQRCGTAGTGPSARARPNRAPAELPPFAFAAEHEPRQEYPTAAAAAASEPAPRAPAADGEVKLSRVSFRLRADYHRQLEKIARLWGVSRQSLLQQAVASFLASALSGEDRCWPN
jgi:hypothetical protein